MAKSREMENSVAAASSRVLCEAAGISVSKEGEICKTWTLQQWLKHNLRNPITGWNPPQRKTDTYTHRCKTKLCHCIWQRARKDGRKAWRTREWEMRGHAGEHNMTRQGVCIAVSQNGTRVFNKACAFKRIALDCTMLLIAFKCQSAGWGAENIGHYHKVVSTIEKCAAVICRE